MRAWLYDGETAVRHSAVLAAADGALVVRIDDGREAVVPAADLLLVEERGEQLALGRTGIAGWRLKLERPLPDEIAALLPRPERYGRWIDRIGLAPAALAGAALSAAVLAVVYFAPAWLTPLVPQGWERRYGEALVGDFGGKFCRAPEGRRALHRLAARLDPATDELNIRVVDIDLVNAVALPGGNIVIFRGLLAEADGPDEVAGVLAHEIAHVRNRHVTEAMLRQFGVGLLVATVGGSTGGNVESVLSLSYSRGAEREADAGAIQALKRAHVSPLPTARFFDRLAKTEADFGGFDQAIAYLSTHPVSRSREQAFAKSVDERAHYTPALAPAEWTALRAICTHPADETVAEGGRTR